MQLKQLKIIIMGICACFILIACDRGTDQKDNQKQEKVDLTKFKRRKLPDSILTIGKDTIIMRRPTRPLNSPDTRSPNPFMISTNRRARCFAYCQRVFRILWTVFSS